MIRTLATLLFVLAAAVLAPSEAAAWTRTEVRGMRARAEVMPSGFARISLEVSVEVQGGWVERFEIAGLGRGAQLDELKPPTWIKTSAALDDTDATPGMKYAPALKLREDGTLALDFGAARRTAPKRGAFASRIVYETRLPLDEDGALLLSLPTWPSALENVELWIDAPRGTTFLASTEADHDGVRVLEQGALTIVHIKKAQLPRTHPLEARLVLPNMTPPRPIAAPPPAAQASDEPSLKAWAIAALLLALIALKRGSLGAASGPAELPFSTVKAMVLVAACAAFPYADAQSPSAGLGALLLAVALGLALPGALHAGGSCTERRYRAAHAIDVERARRARLLARLGPHSWVDATTPSGLALAIMLGALAWLAMEQSGQADNASWLIAWAAVLPLFLARTRGARPPSTGDALEALGAARAALSAAARELGASLRLEVATATLTGPAEHARLRVVPSAGEEVRAPSDPAGRELSLVLAERADGGTTLAWLLTSADGSVLRKCVDPARELPALLRPEAGPNDVARELSRAA